MLWRGTVMLLMLAGVLALGGGVAAWVVVWGGVRGVGVVYLATCGGGVVVGWFRQNRVCAMRATLHCEVALI